MLFVKKGVELSSSKELFENLFLKTKIGFRLIRARPYFRLISQQNKVNLETVDCSFSTRQDSVKDYLPKNGKNMLVYTSVEFMHLKILAKTFNNPGREK